MNPRTISATAVVTSFCALPAHAHMVSTGVGPFYDGVSHIFATPLDLLCLLGIALIGGLGGIAQARKVLLASVVTWSLALPLGTILLPVAWETNAILAPVMIAMGVLVSLDRLWPRRGVLLAVTLLNAYLALAAGAGLIVQPATIQIVSGIWTGVVVTLTLALAFIASRPDNWQRIGLRVLGSWLMAIGLLSLALNWSAT